MVALVDLDMLAGPAGAAADPPSVDSPRSLRACGLCGVDPAAALRPLSLRQHFDLVAGGAPWVDRSPPAGVNVDTALDACHAAGINTGTKEHKLLAYRNYTKHEAARIETLTLVREVRRQLIAEEIFERRRRAHVDRLSHRSSFDLAASHTPEVDQTQMSLQSEKGGNHLYTDPSPTQKRIDIPENIKTNTTHQNKHLEDPTRVVITRSVENEDDWPNAKHVVHLSPLNANIEASPVIQSGINEIYSGVVTEAKMEDDAAVTRGTDHTIGDVAPPAPPISHREQGEVFYYYCANAMAAGRISEYREQSIL
ncbi:dynein heavy chain [Trypanosoma theileri]|uniref:Dynein heavy chain n=1 Tax=Trypanosoma theileri TaxID=67003 RepID=A0A1X0P9Q9_9TRYP|nr:dynein heavy chain [Trypanosoma theileri]ORC93664.1 dynein heavy chain [Trypanosoma theileri]